MSDDADVRDDIRLPEGDLGKDIKSRFDAGEQFMITVIKALDQEAAIGIKNMAK